MSLEVDLLIIGAGPFGLAMAAKAKHLGIDYLVVGKPMDFWKSNMPEGMVLRSGRDWHLDPMDTHTIDRYVQERELSQEAGQPISLKFYLEYTAWFQEQKQLTILPSLVHRLDFLDHEDFRFQAETEDGETIASRNVLLAVGFRNFRHVPEELSNIFPAGAFSHTCDLVDFHGLEQKRCLIVGGRQSAFEWAALLYEHGAEAIQLSYRHDTPSFTESDWSWVSGLVNEMVKDPSWYRNLSPEEQEKVNQRFWAEGRLKLEPWLKPRIDNDRTKTWPRSRIQACRQLKDGTLEVTLDPRENLQVDHIILATGYLVNMARVPFLAAGNSLESLALRNGFPVLDDHFQSSIPNLYITSLPATQDFGPFFGFTVSVRASASIIGSVIASQLR